MISDDKIVISDVRLESDCFTGHCKVCLSVKVLQPSVAPLVQCGV